MKNGPEISQLVTCQLHSLLLHSWFLHSLLLPSGPHCHGPCYGRHHDRNHHGGPGAWCHGSCGDPPAVGTETFFACLIEVSEGNLIQQGLHGPLNTGQGRAAQALAPLGVRQLRTESMIAAFRKEIPTADSVGTNGFFKTLNSYLKFIIHLRKPYKIRIPSLFSLLFTTRLSSPKSNSGQLSVFDQLGCLSS